MRAAKKPVTLTDVQTTGNMRTAFAELLVVCQAQSANSSIFSMHNPIAAVDNEHFALLRCLTSGIDHVCAQNSKYIIVQREAMITVFYVDVVQCVCPP